MQGFTTRHPGRALLGAAALSGGLLLTPILSPQAHAIIAACRTDPIVYLSDGAQVQMSASIYDASTDVKTITYTLHAPAGTNITKVVYTGGAFTGKERLDFYADQPAHTYVSSTYVDTVTSGISVSASTTGRGGTSGATQASVSLSGTDHQTLTVALSL